MKTLKIDDTVYNLAYLISYKYKAKSKGAAKRTKKSDEVESTPASGALKSDSFLCVHFLNCKPIILKKDEADAVWSKLAATLNLYKP